MPAAVIKLADQTSVPQDLTGQYGLHISPAVVYHADDEPYISWRKTRYFNPPLYSINRLPDPPCPSCPEHGTRSESCATRTRSPVLLHHSAAGTQSRKDVSFRFKPHQHNISGTNISVLHENYAPGDECSLIQPRDVIRGTLAREVVIVFLYIHYIPFDSLIRNCK